MQLLATVKGLNTNVLSFSPLSEEIALLLNLNFSHSSCDLTHCGSMKTKLAHKI